jgi:hypothetical protein
MKKPSWQKTAGGFFIFPLSEINPVSKCSGNYREMHVYNENRKQKDGDSEIPSEVD